MRCWRAARERGLLRPCVGLETLFKDVGRFAGDGYTYTDLRNLRPNADTGIKYNNTDFPPSTANVKASLRLVTHTNDRRLLKELIVVSVAAEALFAPPFNTDDANVKRYGDELYTQTATKMIYFYLAATLPAESFFC